MSHGTAPLLASKLRPPRQRSDAVMRSRLVQRFRDSLAAPLVLVAAPAGSGKTTLLTQAMGQLGLPFAWVAIDEADNEPMRFTRHLLAAACQVLPALAESSLDGIELEALVEEILVAAEDLNAAAVLALDDYHLIEQPSIHAAMAALVEAVPRHLRLVLATREDPPLPLARMRARAQLAEIRLVDLRFSPAEAHDFLRSTMALDITPEDSAALLARTEGWAAGLQLAALSLRGRENQSATIARLTGTHRYVLDYLTDEVLDRQPPAVQRFLLRTSILDRLSGSLVEATLGGEEAGEAMLRQIERANLFLLPLDEERQWYRYHALFADLLRSRLLATLPDEVADLHTRAHAWFEQHAADASDELWFLDQARRHALAAGDVAAATDLVARVSARLLAENEQITLLRWLESLPLAVVRGRADLAVSAAWAFGLNGQSAERDARLKDAERALDRGSSALDNEADLRGNVATLRAWSARERGDVDAAIAAYQEALASFPQTGSTGRVAAHLHFGNVLLEADRLAEAEEQLRQAVQRGVAGANRHAGVAAIGFLGDLQFVRGRLSEAAAEYRRALDVGAGPTGRPLPAVSAAYLGLGQVAYQRDDLAAAEAHLVQALQVGEVGANWHISVEASLLLAWLRHVQGDAVAADALVADGERLAARDADDAFVERVPAMRARIALARGDLASVSAWAADRAVGDDLEVNLMRARASIALGATARARPLLEERHGAAERAGRIGDLIAIEVLEAALAEAAGDLARARDMLAQARARGAGEGYVRVFVDERPARAPTTNARTPLSKREQELLGMLAGGLSNQDIADRLVMTVGTVKWYLHHLYGKLGVRGRLAAIARGRELGLLT